MAFAPVPIQRPGFTTSNQQNTDFASFVAPNFLVPDLDGVTIRGRNVGYFLQMFVNYSHTTPNGEAIYTHDINFETPTISPWYTLSPGENLRPMVVVQGENESLGCFTQSIGIMPANRGQLYYGVYISFHRYTPPSLGDKKCLLLSHYQVWGIEFDPIFFTPPPSRPLLYLGNAAPPPPPPKNMDCCTCNDIATIVEAKNYDQLLAQQKLFEDLKDHIDKRSLEIILKDLEHLRALDFEEFLKAVIKRINEVESNLWNGVKQ